MYAGTSVSTYTPNETIPEKGEDTMITRKGSAVWEGGSKQGKGRMKTESGACEGIYSFPSRFEQAEGTNPDEFIGAAHAGCFSMALALELEKAGHPPKQIRTTAHVNLEKVEGGFAITSIDLKTEAQIPNIDAKTFQEKAKGAKENCPVSKALKQVPITLEASLVE